MRIGAAAVALVAVTLAGCTADSAVAPVARDCGVSEHEPSREFVGLALDEAERRAAAAGLEVRVRGRDGSCAWERTGDRSDMRVSLYVESGEVVSAARY
jgi:hypothetical protein